LQDELYKLDARDNAIVNNKTKNFDVDLFKNEKERYSIVKTNTNIFDDEDIIEVSTPAVLENSLEVEEYVEQKPKVELP